jgi:hypothetical protein
VSITKEHRRPAALPVWDIPSWDERFGVHAGIAGGRIDGTAFDLGLWGGQPVGEVMARWRTFRQEYPGCPRTVLAHQIHGTRVLWHAADNPPGWLLVDGADGHGTDVDGILLTVTIADCIPVYLIVPDRRTIALLHAGWRGVAGGMLARGVEAICDRSGASSSDIVMHCGVGICGRCYEVGPEVMDGLGLQADGPGPWLADLRAVLADQAARLGIRECTASPFCSAHDPDFFSHRRSRGTDGRMIAFLGRPADVRGGAPSG